MNQWIEGIHYYINGEGLVVMTEKYHLERGYCCGNGCKHCPYGYKSAPEPEKSEIQKSQESQENISSSNN
ncbi:MAG: DUF5522 domain-containing protein [Chitinophagaceae bacterium]